MVSFRTFLFLLNDLNETFDLCDLLSFQKYLSVLIILAIVNESMLVIGQKFDNGGDKRPLWKVNVDGYDDNSNITIIAALRRPRNYKKLLKLMEDDLKTQSVNHITPTTTTNQPMKDYDQESSTVVVRRITRPSNRFSVDSKPVSSNKKLTTVSNRDDKDFSVRRARFIFSQRTGK